jgi:hypothetical protein
VARGGARRRAPPLRAARRALHGAAACVRSPHWGRAARARGDERAQAHRQQRAARLARRRHGGPRRRTQRLARMMRHRKFDSARRLEGGNGEMGAVCMASTASPAARRPPTQPARCACAPDAGQGPRARGQGARWVQALVCVGLAQSELKGEGQPTEPQPLAPSTTPAPRAGGAAHRRDAASGFRSSCCWGPCARGRVRARGGAERARDGGRAATRRRPLSPPAAPPRPPLRRRPRRRQSFIAACLISAPPAPLPPPPPPPRRQLRRFSGRRRS